jgi:hypothetical protein
LSPALSFSSRFGDSAIRKREMLVKRLKACQWIARALASAVVISALTMVTGCTDAKSEAALEALELVDVAGYWAVRGQDQEKNNYIHPLVRFRVHNRAESPVDYVQAMAVFKRENLPDEPWGNAFLYSIAEEPIPPGGTSDLQVMRSDTNFVSKDAPEQMFQNAMWERVDVEIFLRVGASRWRIFEDFEVPKRIGAPGLEKFLQSEPDADPEHDDLGSPEDEEDPARRNPA